eukprot:TRINITY_DN16457_c0_g1_i1.p1 TRINITY_DN16457_c0_g1~~TRINITY_DN16457_c0_g1_i1.p1  ORF type:complete len:520 (+),score=55.89 TRINITY_DN16457_c0_g1_i1:36-1595(+)
MKRAVLAAVALQIICFVLYRSKTVVREVEDGPVNNTTTRPHDALYDANAYGRWMWDPDSYKGEVLVVVGAFNPDPTPALLARGYMVWKPNTGCLRARGSKCEFSSQTHRFNERHIRVRGYPLLAYATYLQDPSPPTATYTVFMSDNHKTFFSELDTALTTVQTTQRFTPLSTTEVVIFEHARYEAFKRTLDLLHPGNTLSHPLKTKQGFQFAIPTSLISPKVKYGLLLSFQLQLPAPARAKPLDYRQFFEFAFPQLFPGGASKRNSTVLSASAVVRFNEMGTWVYDPRGANLDTIVVVGGTDKDPTEALVPAGYTVWRRNEDCTKQTSAVVAAPERQIRFTCHEMWGYFGYLTDTDPWKPVGKQVAFIHGHLESWHQPGSIDAIVADAVTCSKATNNFVALTKVRTKNINRRWQESGQAEQWISIWNENFGDIRKLNGNRLESYCCATAVVPQAVIAKKEAATYARFVEPKFMVQVGGFFYEFVFAMMFDQPEEINTTAQIPECKDFTYADKVGFAKPP